MKYLGFTTLALLLSVWAACAQVTVEIITDQDQFLPSEAVPIAVRVINRSGQTLQLGKDPDWLTFNIDSQDGIIVFKTGEVPVVKEFELESGKMATKHVELGPYFNLTKLGRYTVTATVKIKAWNREISSVGKQFDVVQPFKLWEQEFGVPGTNQGPPEVRKYVLENAPYLQHSKLYLRVTDAQESQVFKVFPVGPMISFSRPDPQIDGESNLHLLYQTASHTFLYSMIDPQGTVMIRRTYDYASSRPQLKQDKHGKIFVQGGVRHFTDDDIPSSDPSLTSNAVTPPTP